MAEKVQLERAAEQMEAFFDVFPAAEARRRVCICGCGRWWYEAHRPGRWRNYATQECRLKIKALRERARRSALAPVIP